MTKVRENLTRIRHPNSRKTAVAARLIRRKESRQRTKLLHICMQNLVADKLTWFQEHLIADVKKYSPQQTENVIFEYMARFGDELEQISLKQSVGKRKSRQHASREDVIKLAMDREAEEYETCGIEIPDVMDEKQLDLLKNWTGELKYLQNFKLRRITRKFLEEKIENAKDLDKESENKEKKESDDKTTTNMECNS